MSEAPWPCGPPRPHSRSPHLNGSVPRKASPRGSPSVAVDRHGFSWGVLSALVEAGTPFQCHTPVLMPDLRERNLNVLGAIVSDLKPCWEDSLKHRPGQGTHAQAGARQTRIPVHTDPHRSAGDTLCPLPSYPAGTVAKNLWLPVAEAPRICIS